MKPATREKLEALLGAIKDEPGLDALEDRVAESGHLEEADYAAVLERRVEGQALDNLRRHVLFCDVCSQELLRRAAPAAEDEYAAEEREGARRRRRRRLRWVLPPLLLIAAATWWILRPPPVQEPVPPEGPQRAVPELQVERAWAGEGRRAEGAPRELADRLFLRLRATKDSHGTAHVCIFHVAGALITPLHPRAASSKPWALDASLQPLRGLADPGGPDPAHLLVLLSGRPMVRLATPGDRESFARTLQRFLLDGHVVTDLRAMLESDAGTGASQVLLVPVHR